MQDPSHVVVEQEGEHEVPREVAADREACGQNAIVVHHPMMSLNNG
jgi:hypothetical protein